eukprot:gene39370-53228_t
MVAVFVASTCCQALAQSAPFAGMAGSWAGAAHRSPILFWQTGAFTPPPMTVFAGEQTPERVRRLLDAFEKRGIKPTLSINAKVCDTCPELAGAARDAGWEFMAHCYVQMPIHKVEDEAAMIRQSAERLESFLGHRPRGWLGPGRTQTFDTLDHVAAAGFDWFGDWILDDQPFW